MWGRPGPRSASPPDTEEPALQRRLSESRSELYAANSRRRAAGVGVGEITGAGVGVGVGVGTGVGPGDDGTGVMPIWSRPSTFT